MTSNVAIIKLKYSIKERNHLSILLEIFRTLIVPIVIGIATVYFSSIFEQRKLKAAEEKEKKENLNKIESHYFKIVSHTNSLAMFTNEKELNYSKCKIEILAVQKLLGELNIDILPRELKHYYGFFIHSFDKRAIEVIKLLEDSCSVSEVAHFDTQLHSTSTLMQEHYITPLKKYLGIQ
jgi:hypothetical protein